MIPTVVIRPQPGCDKTVEAARQRRLNAHGFPMFEVRAVAWNAPDPDSIDALLIGSANAIRHGGEALAKFAGKSVYAVGEATAEAAREAGFDVLATGEGGLQSLFEQLDPKHRKLLRLAGQQRVVLTPPEDVTLFERIAYSSDALPMPQQLKALLDRPAVVLLHSGEAARHFAASCQARGIDRSRIALACIGERVVDAAGEGWRAVRAADQPSEGPLLALALEMCKEEPRSPEKTPKPEYEARKGLMQDQTGSQTIATMPSSRRNGRGQILVAALAFVLGAAVVVWSAWRGYLDNVLPQTEQEQPADEAAAEGAPELALKQNEQAKDSAENLQAVSTVEGRLAMLEDRFSRLNLQANAASGNAARAESLLIAFAARRMIERGEPLTYLSDQLRLRFTNAQPKAVETIIAFGEDPVTVDELNARLDALTPRLSGTSDDESFWEKARRELSSLFTVRTEPSSLMSPEARIERARVMVTARKIPEAVEQVRRLPGAEAADKWIADALRYEAAQKALDLIETTAMLDPNRLQDAEGNKVDQPSPLATPAAEKVTARKSD